MVTITRFMFVKMESLEIICNKSLSDKFDLFERDNNEYFGKWSSFSLDLQTYWKNNNHQ